MKFSLNSLLLTSVALTRPSTVTGFAPPTLGHPPSRPSAGGSAALRPSFFSSSSPVTAAPSLTAFWAPMTATTATATYSTTFTRLYAKKKDKKNGRRSNEDDDDDYSDSYNDSLGLPKSFDNLDDLEAARKSFEKLWVQQHRQETVNPVDLQHHYSLLQKRHEQEIRLLKRLEFSDDAVQELLKLWSTTIVPPVGFGPLHSDDSNKPMSSSSSSSLNAKFATAPSNTMLTLDADFLHAKSSDIQQDAEAKELMAVADRHPEWAEPRLRLAAYHHRRGEVLLAYEWALKGLEIQPYHFVSSTIFLLLSIQQQHDAEIEYWERMRLPTGFGTKRTAWVQRALHECHERFEAHASDIRKLLDSRHKSSNNNSRPRSVVVSKSTSSSLSEPTYEQLSPMRPDVDVNSMFGGLTANDVDPFHNQHQPVSRDLHSFRKNPPTASSSSSAVPMPPPSSYLAAPRQQQYNDEYNPRPNFGDDHWSNNPNGVFDIHGRVRDSPTSSSGSSASDSMSNFYQPPPPSSSSSRRSTPPPSYEQLEGLGGEWE